MGVIKDLYEVTGQWLALQELIEDLPEDEEQTFLDTLEGINGELDVCIDQIGFIVKNLQVRVAGLRGEACAVEAEAQRINKKADTLEHRSERLLNSLLQPLQTTTEDGKRKTDHFSCSIRRSEETVIDNESLIPANYMKKTETIKPNKTAIKEALKAGKQVAGAHINEKYKVQMR